MVPDHLDETMFRIVPRCISGNTDISLTKMFYRHILIEEGWYSSFAFEFVEWVERFICAYNVLYVQIEIARPSCLVISRCMRDYLFSGYH